MKLLSSQLQFLALAIMIMTASAAMAQGGYVAPMSLDEAINNPSIRDNKVRSSVSNYQMKQAKILLEDRNLIVETMRNKEVIVISIPADLLFEPNETELSDDASDVLEHFRGFLRTPDFYRMALAMYHDDSCSNSFSRQLTDKRVQSVYDWFALYSGANYVSTFSFGNTNFLKPNNSIQNRRLNRRLEIYLIPGNAMIDQAKRNLLK